MNTRRNVIVELPREDRLFIYEIYNQVFNSDVDEQIDSEGLNKRIMFLYQMVYALYTIKCNSFLL